MSRIGINENSFNQLILDVFDYAEKIKCQLNAIDNTMNRAINGFNGDIKVVFAEKYNSLRPNFEKVNDIIVSYTDELNTVKKNANNLQDLLVDTTITHKTKVATKSRFEPTKRISINTNNKSAFGKNRGGNNE